jgi:predicted nucleotidyltransferase
LLSLRSKVTKKVLTFFFTNPHQDLYVNEMAVLLGVDKRNLVKKLRELESVGLMRSEARGNLRLYSVNPSYPLYREYKRIFQKTVGVEARLRDVVSLTPGVKRALIFGSYAMDAMQTHSDIDILVVGDHSVVSFQKELNKIQREIEREVNCVHMNEDEFRRKEETEDAFLLDVFAHPTIELAPCATRENISPGTRSRRSKSENSLKTRATAGRSVYPGYRKCHENEA